MNPGTPPGRWALDVIVQFFYCKSKLAKFCSTKSWWDFLIINSPCCSRAWSAWSDSEVDVSNFEPSLIWQGLWLMTMKVPELGGFKHQFPRAWNDDKQPKGDRLANPVWTCPNLPLKFPESCAENLIGPEQEDIHSIADPQGFFDISWFVAELWLSATNNSFSRSILVEIGRTFLLC